MQTACIPQPLLFQPQGRRRVEADFDAGRVSTDGGLLLLREVAERTAIFELFADCFADYRDPRRVEHSVSELLAQRVLAIACGYEDLNDHARLRNDPLLAVAVGKADPFGEDRPRERDRGFALASPATLNRIELGAANVDPNRGDLKIVCDNEAIEEFFVDQFLDAFDEPPEEIVLDVDATDDPLHGEQEGRYFHGYCYCYCYLPLYIFCDGFLLAAKLRPSNQDGAAGAVEELQRIVDHIRRRWPDVRIVIRGDSGFCRDALMDWCEQTPGLDFVIGVARNARLTRAIENEMTAMEAQVRQTGQSARCFKDLSYRTLDSWSRERRVVAKAEHLVGKANPRFVATSLTAERFDARALYEGVYCARGDMENRIKEQQMGMFADRTSAHAMRANQLRVWLSACAYVLVHGLRTKGLAGTEASQWQVWTIRGRLLKIGCLVRRSVRRVKVSLSSAFPLQELFATALHNIQHAYPLLV